MRIKQAILLLAIAIFILCYFIFDLKQYLKSDFLLHIYQQHNILTTIIYCALAVLITAFSLPIATLMTLAAGYLFGFWKGMLIISFASTIGATLACFIARTLLRDWVTKTFSKQLEYANKGLQRDGISFLFTLRLIPIVPFFVINLLMGLTRMPIWTFYWVSQLGMLAGTAVYINAGAQLSQLEQFNLNSVLTVPIISAFVLLGLFPWIAKKAVHSVRQHRLYRSWKKIKKFDYNIVVIGAGSAGLVSAYIASMVRAKVCLIEKNKMGGDCLNTGCVPSKTLIRSAKIKSYIERANEFGIHNVKGKLNFKHVMERVQRIIQKIEPHDSVSRYTQLGVDCKQGMAKIISPWEVTLNDQVITTKNIIIATGADPTVPSIAGLDKVTWYTSDTIWSIRKQPAQLLVIGGGPVGCELAQAFHRLGSCVTIISKGNTLLSREDDDVSTYIMQQFTHEGIQLQLDRTIKLFDADETSQWIELEDEHGTTTITFDAVLFACGRTAKTDHLGLESLGIERTSHGTISVNEYLQTLYPNIYACGDVAGPYQFTHVAAHQAWYATVNALFHTIKKFKVNNDIIPWCTFTDPEIAHVGLSEKNVQDKKMAYEITRYDLSQSDRAISEGEDKGFIKVITAQNKDKILGVTIVGHHAGELIIEFILAMKYKLGLNKILSTIHIYPTLAESNKHVAGCWKKQRIPNRLLNFVEKWHKWMRHTF